MSKTEIPSIRFRGFDDAWEQRKLGDQMYIKARIGWQALTKNEYMESGDYYLVTGTDIDESSHTVDLLRCHYVTKERYDADNKIQLKEGDIIVTKDGTIGKVAMITGLDKPATLNSHLFVLRDLSGKLDNYYLLTILTSPIFEKFVVGTKTGSTLTGLPQKTMVTFEFTAPNIQEQQKIAGYFRNLDNLITLHRRKFEKLTNVKKSMLKKMFPQNGSSYPEIRFKGFTDPWEQRKLGELCNITTGKLDANAMVSDGQYDFYTSGIDVFKIDVAAFEGPAITIAGNGASVGYMHLADGKFNAYQRTYVLTDFLADRQFLNVAIGNELPDKIQEEVRGSGIPYIVLNMLTDLAIPFPSHEEQYAIGVYFQQLDNLITLHQRELEKLQSIKKALLEKMFV